MKVNGMSATLLELLAGLPATGYANSAKWALFVAQLLHALAEKDVTIDEQAATIKDRDAAIVELTHQLAMKREEDLCFVPERLRCPRCKGGNTAWRSDSYHCFACADDYDPYPPKDE